MVMVSVETGFTGRRRNWCSGGYFNSGRADRSGFNFQITADQSGRDDFREDHQRKFGNIGG